MSSEILTVGACPIESFEVKNIKCLETERNATCVGIRNKEMDATNKIYPMRFCKRGFYGTLCDKSSDTVKFSGAIESFAIVSLANKCPQTSNISKTELP